MVDVTSLLVAGSVVVVASGCRHLRFRVFLSSVPNTDQIRIFLMYAYQVGQECAVLCYTVG